MAVGYEYLREHFAPTAFAFKPVAKVAAVTRLSLMGDVLAVPAAVAPGDSLLNDPLAHLLFALKHEGTNLQVLAQALPLIPDHVMVDAFNTAPTGSYIRVACFLWEQFSGLQLDVHGVSDSAKAVFVFDPKRYVTVARPRDAKWHVSFNGLGTIGYCPMVRLTAAVRAGIQADTLSKTEAFISSLGPVATDRALAWAYMHETEDSFAIERESPSFDKAQAFVGLLQQAHQRRDVTEAYLVDLQNTVVSNSLDKATQYRTEQNWLRGPGRGALGISYVPPAPALAAELMGHLEAMANQLPSQIDALVAASVCAFGFVYVHPFMDGNGRLSRFLFHHTLCKSGRLKSGLILPVSVAMKRREADYLRCLQSFSKPARAGWRVLWIDEGKYNFEFTGSESNYRFWDATECVEFGFSVAAQALEIDLRQETDFLARYDAVYAAVDKNFNIRNNDLATLVTSTLDNAGIVSKNRRKQFEGRVPEAAFEMLERVAQRCLGLQV